MASIFTFDPDPPRVSSPWATPPLEPRRTNRDEGSGTPLSRLRTNYDREATDNSPDSIVDYSNITKLEAEPQEGPTEYKLHLLLRRRRSFLQTTTGRHISGSLRRAEAPTPVAVSRSVSETNILPNTPPTLSSTQSRQHRLEQLTTQLLWRLQQSCPCHISSSTAPLLPTLPDEAQLSTPEFPQRLLPGLEESKGALYEIGVADDGTFVGLAEDEMEESLNNLRAMAASLGCRVEVQRMVSVGECEWIENAGTQHRNVRSSKLLVAEALVRPDQHLVDFSRNIRENENQGDVTTDALLPTGLDHKPVNAVDQLRVSLTGATMSGKSSLLGSLSTATLDNGRGKSRLSLLKHRHEIVSGMTSSITQELIGYRDTIGHDGARLDTQVIGYGSGDVTSWIDIHGSVETAEHGRLVFLSDSAGHPRFRRTALRGLVGWQPHWTLLCVPADNTEDSSGKIGASPTPQEILGPAAANLDLSHAYLQLCLSLDLPLVVVVTKYDLATRAGLRQTLANVLSALKEAGRKPCIVSDPSSTVTEADLHTLSKQDLHYADGVIQGLKTSPLALVPIILTSAVKGTGINRLHAFLRELPIPSVVPPPPDSPSHLFYIEDVYSTNTRTDHSVIIGGHLRYGTLKIGDELVLGPYPVDTYPDDSDSGSGRHSSRNSPVPTSRSFPGALHKGHSRNTAARPTVGSLSGDGYTEWRRVRIISLRNLRLPVRTLHADQVGTIGIAPVGAPISSPAINRIRKGMVLANREPRANRVITVRFSGTDAQAVKHLSVGSAVVVYVASVRASSKVVSVATEAEATSSNTNHAGGDADDEDEEDAFGFGFDSDEVDEGGAGAALEQHAVSPSSTTTIVTFQFIGSREFVEVDATVLVLPGGGPGLSGSTERGEKGVAGLEGFVGKVC